jgi:hypothetical protein
MAVKKTLFSSARTWRKWSAKKKSPHDDCQQNERSVMTPFPGGTPRQTHRFALSHARIRAIMKIACITVLFSCGLLAWPTSIAVQIEQRRIFVAGDTLSQVMHTGSTTEDETYCKISALGNFAFAETGLADYTPADFQDTIPTWDARSDAAAAYALHPTDLIALARDWAGRAQDHYSLFYRVNPSRVRSLASNPSSDPLGLRPSLLLVGLFIGFKDSQPIVIAELIYLDPVGLQPINFEEKTFDISSSPFSTHAITQELFNSNTSRAQIAQRDWSKQSATIAPESIAYRKLEFFIQRTAQLDSTVGTTVDILELDANQSPRWIQSPTCPWKHLSSSPPSQPSTITTSAK